MRLLFFFFNDTATTEIYTLSLHDALPICGRDRQGRQRPGELVAVAPALEQTGLEHGLGQLLDEDRKSTRLNSSHANISYAVFCLKKKKINRTYVQRHVPTLAPLKSRPSPV